MRHTFSFYVVFLKDEKNCELVYGRQRYDYQKGSVVCLAPGQVIGIEDTGEEFQPQGYALCFHPDLIRGTNLGRNIKEYTFSPYFHRLSDEDTGGITAFHRPHEQAVNCQQY